MATEGQNLSTDADAPARRQGLFEKLRRMKRAWIGKLVSDMVGENKPTIPPPADSPPASDPGAPAPPRDSLKTDIEESGLLGGISNRLRRTADQYLNQKLDEIESRIDRKLQEIDHRLSEWRDKEIANRIKILKITLWASVIVGVVSLIYAWIKAYYFTP
jgi:hypothetical protein